METNNTEPSLKDIQAKIAESGGSLTVAQATATLIAQAKHEATQPKPAEVTEANAPDAEKAKGKK